MPLFKSPDDLRDLSNDDLENEIKNIGYFRRVPSIPETAGFMSAFACVAGGILLPWAGVLASPFIPCGLGIGLLIATIASSSHRYNVNTALENISYEKWRRKEFQRLRLANGASPAEEKSLSDAFRTGVQYKVKVMRLSLKPRPPGRPYLGP